MEKSKRTSFFEVKLLKYPLGEKKKDYIKDQNGVVLTKNRVFPSYQNGAISGKFFFKKKFIDPILVEFGHAVMSRWNLARELAKLGQKSDDDDVTK
jgi:hypothetical protein